MLIAHLPAGYLLARAARARGAAFAAILLGSVVPDIDALWWLAFEAGSYQPTWPHIPALWILAGIFLVPLANRRWPKMRRANWLFLGGVALHLMLDNLSDGIMWLWPWSSQRIIFVYIPAVNWNWLVSVLTHWTLVTEGLITALALWLWLRRPKAAPQNQD